MKNKSENKRKRRRSNSSKRTISLCLMILIILGLIGGIIAVNFIKADKKSVQAHIVLEDDNGVFFNHPVTVTAEKPTAAMALEKLFREKEIPYKYDAGMFSMINNLSLNETHSWMFYLNGKQPEVGTKNTEIKEDDIITMKYEDFSKFLVPGANEAEKISVNVISVISDGETVETSVLIEKGKTVKDAICEAAKTLGVTCSFTDGKLNSYGDYTNGENEFWQILINDEIKEDALDTIEAREEDKITISFGANNEE